MVFGYALHYPFALHAWHESAGGIIPVAVSNQPICRPSWVAYPMKLDGPHENDRCYFYHHFYPPMTGNGLWDKIPPSKKVMTGGWFMNSIPSTFHGGLVMHGQDHCPLPSVAELIAALAPAWYQDEGSDHGRSIEAVETGWCGNFHSVMSSSKLVPSSQNIAVCWIQMFLFFLFLNISKMFWEILERWALLLEHFWDGLKPPKMGKFERLQPPGLAGSLHGIGIAAAAATTRTMEVKLLSDGKKKCTNKYKYTHTHGHGNFMKFPCHTGVFCKPQIRVHLCGLEPSL